ncbi:FAD-dependent oxidoreductase [Reyranella sp. CPCC 100927]|nr:FAD-dependent oxidoreductase [Reyranella sp. CPCC 100927]
MTRPLDEPVSADIVVVGGGGSGLAAAIEAASRGSSVILLEKNEATGGSTGWSVGSITATRTPDQKRRGIDDNADDHFTDLGLLAGRLVDRDNLALRRLLTQNVTDTVAWLRRHGVEFFGPMPEQPHRQPRMHNVLPTSRAYIYHLTRAARRAGVDIRLNTRARRILLDGPAATGIEADTPAGSRRFLARQGVILAGGDYSGSSHFKALYGNPALAAVPAINRTNTGDCQQMVLDIGGEVLNGDLILGPVLRFIAPRRRRLFQVVPPWRSLTFLMRTALHHLPAAVIRPLIMRFMTTVMAPEASLLRDGAMLVGATGAGINIGDGPPGLAVAAQSGNTAYLVFDQAIAERYSRWPHPVSTAPGVAYAYFPDYRRTRPDLVHSAPSLAALATRTGMSGSALQAAADAHRQARASGGGDLPPPLARPPFHALGPIQSFIVLTDGGVKVGDDLRVIVERDRPVDRLFAAGSTGQGGVLLEGHGHHLGWAFTSGRIAARNATALARRVPADADA